ncbi:MAG: DNA translocase FtsK [Lachnospiraceae bacterium]|nr:DNA translocase FtsK [Lachnospiraceae bacterium]
MATNTKRKNSTKRSSTSNTKKSRSQSTTKKEMARRAEIRSNLIGIGVVCLSILFFIGNIGFGGIVGNYLSEVLFGLFGLINYLFPILLVGLTIYYFMQRDKEDIRTRIVLFGVLYWLLANLVELITNGANTVGPAECFRNGFYHQLGGGFFGGVLAEFLISVFGIVPAYIFTFMGIIGILIWISGFKPSEYLKGFFADREALREEREKEYAENEAKEFNRDRRRKRREKTLSVKEEAPKRTSRANSNIRPGRPTKTEENPKEEIDKTLPRRERTVTGMSFDTEIAPVYSSNSIKSDDMNEIHPEMLEQYINSNEEDNSFAEKLNTEDKIKVNTTSLVHENYNETASNDRSFNDNFSRPSWEDLWESNNKEDVTNSAPEVLEVSNEVISPSQDLKEVTPVSAFDPEETFTDSFKDGHSSEYDLYSDRKSRLKTTADVKPTVTKVEPTVEKPVEKIEEEVIEEVKPPREYIFPPTDILTRNKNSMSGNVELTLKKTADKLEMILKNFGVNVKVTDYSRGPSVTRYELLPEMGTKVSKIVNLTDDIKMNLAATDIRIEAPIPGKNAIGIEVPNNEKTMVGFRELVESPTFKESKSKIAFALGLDLAGKVIISDIAKMPHLLIAGATGSGKSVCINTIIMSILYKANPDDVKFIMIDPKVVELSVYNGIPHLLIPVVTDPKKAAGALQWAVNEMMDRYKKFADCHVRDMAGYNERIKDGKMEVINNGQKLTINAKKMPQIVVIVDELADLMMVASKEVEESICRLAQLARAAGIHLIIATQRPSVNVITGLIKANMPSRIAFAVTSGVDSRTILDMVGAERLLGKGDMLYYPQGIPKPLRVQGAFVTDKDVMKATQFIRENNKPDEDDQSAHQKIMEAVESASSSSSFTSIDSSDGGQSNDRDEYFTDAARLLIEKDKGSIGMLQRNFKIGFNRAARIIDQLEEFGVVGPEVGTKPRKILVTMEEFESMLQNEGGN